MSGAWVSWSSQEPTNISHPCAHTPEECSGRSQQCGGGGLDWMVIIQQTDRIGRNAFCRISFFIPVIWYMIERRSIGNDQIHHTKNQLQPSSFFFMNAWTMPDEQTHWIINKCSLHTFSFFLKKMLLAELILRFLFLCYFTRTHQFHFSSKWFMPIVRRSIRNQKHHYILQSNYESLCNVINIRIK